MKKLIIALLVFLPFSLNAQWEILNGGINGWINTMDFVNEEVYWIAGDAGNLQKTTDGGQNWITITIDENWNIGTIDFINESIGWAIGNIGGDTAVVWKSLDGGFSWLQQLSNVDFNSLYAIDENNVYAFGHGDPIFKTTNGGTDWIDISPNLPDRRYNSIWFENPQIGVVVGSYYDGGTPDKGIILKTTDGGNTWIEDIVNEFNYITDLQFLDNTNGYFRANSDTANFICKTEDMCVNWTIKTQNAYSIISYQFLDSNTAYAIMGDSITENNVMKSIDGGISWQNVESLNGHLLLNPYVGSLSNIYFCNQSVGFLLSNIRVGRIVGRLIGGALYKSIDSDHWAIQKFSYPLSDVCFLDNDKGILVGGWGDHSSVGNIFSTNNGGKTWNMNYNPMDILQSCIFVNDLVAFSLSTSGVIYKTSDSGNNWITIFENNPDSNGYEFWVSDIVFENEGMSWTVGRYCQEGCGAGILSTTDSGESWDLGWQFPDTANYEYNLKSIYFIETSGWTVGDGGMIVKYTPQTGWAKQTSVTDIPLNKVFFSDNNHGWIAGGYQNGNGFLTILLKTTNGGANWIQVSGLQYLINDIAFIDNNLGWAIGYTETGTGGILKSTDGGNTWEVSVGNLNEWLSSLTIKGNYGWVVGGNGLILRTTNAGVTWVDNENGKIYPTEFVLEQNYPNPFNPTTKIKYSIPNVGTQRAVSVQIKVYDVLGREVATLVNEEKAAGLYEVDFDATNFSSGVVFYQLKAGSFIQTKKMVILK